MALSGLAGRRLKCCSLSRDLFRPPFSRSPPPAHLLKDTKAFSSRRKNVISPACPGSASRPPPGGTSLEHVNWETSQSDVNWLLSMWRSRISTPSDPPPPFPPQMPSEEAHFHCYYPLSHSLGHYPELVT